MKTIMTLFSVLTILFTVNPAMAVTQSERVHQIIAEQLGLNYIDVTDEGELQRDLGATPDDVGAILLQTEDEFHIDLRQLFQGISRFKTVKNLTDAIKLQIP